MTEVIEHKNKSFTVKVTEKDDNIDIDFIGRSSDRDPSEFLNPILTDLIYDEEKNNKFIVMNFKNLEYMNSSTITPITKILEKAKESKIQLKVRYNSKKKWQDLCFAALKIFETKDQRISISGE